MENSSGAAHRLLWAAFFGEVKPRPWNFASRRPQPEYSRGEMFGRMHLALLAEDVLSSGNLVGIKKTVMMMSKACPQRRAGGGCQRHTPRAAVQIERKPRTPREDCTGGGLQDFLNVRIPFEHGAEPRLYYHGDAQVRAILLEQSERGGGEDAISQRTQADSRNSRAVWQTLQNGSHRARLLFDARFVDQHDGNVVANWIHPLAFHALESVFVLLQLDRGLAQRAHQDLQ